MSRRLRPWAGVATVALAPAIVLCVSGARAGRLAGGQMATAERLEGAGFWPTQGRAPRDAYAGPGACAACHASRAAMQQRTAMARTFATAAESEALERHGQLSFRSGRYEFVIERRGTTSVYRVSDGAATITSRLAWAFGAGKVGQTYLFERDGVLREARVSYFGATSALGFTPTRAVDAPMDLEDAAGRVVPPAEARRCFGCHTTASSVSGRLVLDSLVPGVTCEACHGPGRAHVEAMARPIAEQPRETIVNPEGFSPADSVDFCGACHATFWDVTLAGERGLAALRSQPFRLQSSRCWGDGGDDRLTCVACHDPHAPLTRDVGSYDAACLSCHSEGRHASARQPPDACRVRPGACASCHMPSYEVPEMFARFTDHRIRVVR